MDDEAREAAALRANLQRRKEQMRARAAEVLPALDEKIDSMGEFMALGFFFVVGF